MIKKNNFASLLSLTALAKKVDLGFIMDSSSSFGNSNYQMKINFIKKMASSFQFLPQQTLAGVITYSDNAEVSATLTTMFYYGWEIKKPTLVFFCFLFFLLKLRERHIGFGECPFFLRQCSSVRAY